MGYTRRLKWFIAQIPEAANATLSLLTFFELFSGMRAWSRGMEMFDYHGQSADCKYHEFTEKTVKCDFLTPMGFLQVIASIMRMHARSIFLAAIPCSSWIFMSRWSTGRDKHILGHHRMAWIRAQNALVARMVYVLILCIKRGIMFIVEQPWSSIVWQHPRWQYLEKRYGHLLHYVETDMGIYSLDLVKKSILVGTASYLPELGSRLTPAGRQAVLDNPHKKATAKHYVDSEGNTRTQGGPDLKGTEEYSIMFGARHALLYKSTWGSAPENQVPGMSLQDCDSDSEIGDEPESCFEDFKLGFDTFQYSTSPSTTSASSNKKLWDTSISAAKKQKVKKQKVN